MVEPAAAPDTALETFAPELNVCVHDWEEDTDALNTKVIGARAKPTRHPEYPFIVPGLLRSHQACRNSHAGTSRPEESGLRRRVGPDGTSRIGGKSHFWR